MVRLGSPGGPAHISWPDTDVPRKHRGMARWRGNHAMAVGLERGYLPAERMAARGRAGASYRRPPSQSWVAAWRPLPL